MSLSKPQMMTAVLLVGMFPAGRGSCRDEPKTAAQAWAEKMFVDGTCHDFGIVAHGAQHCHRFTITNIYDTPIEITGIRTGCGSGRYLTVNATKRLLAPRQTAFLEVFIDARMFVGPKTQVASVTFGPNFVATAEVRVSADSRPEMVVNPGAAMFGSVPRGQAPTAMVDVEYAGKLDWRVSEATTARGAPFEATVKETYRKPGEVGYRVTVTLKRDAAPGPFTDFVLLRTNDPDAARLQVLVDGNVQSPLEVSPASLNLNDVKVREVLTRRVAVRGSEPFRVLGIDSPGGVKLGTGPTALAKSLQVLTFQIQASQPGPFHHEVKFKTDLQDAPVVVVIEGIAVP